MPRLSYLICGTPRTASTLLCSLLVSSGIAGRPESYFREADERAWAERWGIRVSADGSFDYAKFVQGALRAGTTDNGVFGARVMWGSLDHVVENLRAQEAHRRVPDVAVLERAFGPLFLVHLVREDVLGQAVSWARAEQTGYWQRGDVAAAGRSPHYDRELIDHLLGTIADHNRAWQRWFAKSDHVPFTIRYEDLVSNQGEVVRRTLSFLGLHAPECWKPVSEHRRQADELNAEWRRRYLSGRVV